MIKYFFAPLRLSGEIFEYMRHLPFLYITLFVLGCNSVANKEETATEKRQYLRQANPVEILILKPSDFKKELVSNGKLNARKKSVLKFKVSEELTKINFRNGDYVKKGTIIAELNNMDRKSKVERAKINFRKAELELADFFMGHGQLELKDSLKMKRELFEIGKVRSGYDDANFELKTAQRDYESCFMKAPFSGKIADLNYRTHEHVSTGEEFCTLIDDREFEVEFSVLETELKDVAIGKSAKIVPFSMNTEFSGTITEINPMVDENGLIAVKALVRNAGPLLEGMNVKIFIESVVHGQLVVPKEAVVLRQNQEVLFKIVDKKAYWTYVKTLNENSSAYAVIAHPDKGATLQPGDTVIISGNLNLAHESEIEVKEKKIK